MNLDPKSTYYDIGGIETMDIIRAKLGPEQFCGYLLGNIIKYSCRLPHKGNPGRDAEKLGVYSSLLSELLGHTDGIEIEGNTFTSSDGTQPTIKLTSED